MHVGHSLPVIVQAFVFMTIIQVDMLTLIALIAMAVAGAWLGARSITRWPRNYIQIGLGLALGVAAITFVMQLLGVELVSNLTGIFYSPIHLLFLFLSHHLHHLNWLGLT